ncbi:hypothetical protein SCHPADRAFT_696157 [Schizopora paradoxa]|uniref:Uncharacterized protein n=1 Tax=Schizopora paradoxa TaxID=27342 RepID=A0A0H2RN27_9AGAM|nr:hypothetical protein SCHPADRAFT_696157 [Schizopora paradoxa]
MIRTHSQHISRFSSSQKQLRVQNTMRTRVMQSPGIRMTSSHISTIICVLPSQTEIPTFVFVAAIAVVVVVEGRRWPLLGKWAMDCARATKPKEASLELRICATDVACDMQTLRTGYPFSSSTTTTTSDNVFITPQ